MADFSDVKSTALLYQRGFLNSIKPDVEELDNEISQTQSLIGAIANTVAKGERDFRSSTTDRTERIQELDSIFKQTMDSSISTDEIKYSMKDTMAFVNNQSGAITMDRIQSQIQPVPAERYFSSQIEKKKTELDSKGESQKYTGPLEDKYHAFRSDIYEIINEDSNRSMGNIQVYMKDYVQDDDIEIEQEHISYKCPLTKKYYEDAVTSQVCNHSFSKAAIYQLFRRDVQTILCPIPACAHRFSLKHLRPNPRLQERANREQLQEQKRQNKEHDQLEKLQ